MKITVDEAVFNKVILSRKFEVATWLLEQGCPTNYMCYLQNLDITILDWLFSTGIAFNKSCLFDVIQKTDDKDIISWFCSKGAIVDSKCVNSCIKNDNLELLEWLMEKNSILLSVENYKEAVSIEDTAFLDYLKLNKCPYDETVIEYALKNSKKQAIKWLVNNDFF